MTSIRAVMWLGLFASFAAAYFFQSTGLATETSLARVTPYFILFFALSDTPHFFLTFLRSHLDREEWLRHRIYHTLGFALIFCITAGAYFASSEHYLEFVQYLGSFHIYRQNVGFHRLALRQGEISPIQAKQEQRYYFGIMLFAWLVPHFIPMAFVAGMLLNVGVVAVTFAAMRLRFSERIIYFTLTQMITFWAFKDDFNPAVGTIVETLYHDIQYIFFMLAFQTYRQLPLRNFAILFVAGGVFGYLAESNFLAPDARRWVYAFVLGVLVYHYVIDGLIWRFSRSPELKTLGRLTIFKKLRPGALSDQISKAS